MGRDNQAKDRQLRRELAKKAQRASYARILIVTEGSKTEPLYLKEICSRHRLHSANVEVQPSQLGTAPERIVKYAEKLFREGDLHKGIRPRSFDQVYAVFDCDDHACYHNALRLSKSLDGTLRNDEKQPVRFKAIASIPNFELWLLLHYEDIHHAIPRNEVMKRLKKHFPNYSKGSRATFATTQHQLDVATQRAQALALKFTEFTDPEPFTALHELVAVLKALRN